MPAKKYIRVKDTRTGHEYDVLEHMVDPAKHELVDKEHYPPTSRPRPAKPNAKGRPAAAAQKTPTKAAPRRRSKAPAKTSEKQTPTAPADQPDADQA